MAIEAPKTTAAPSALGMHVDEPYLLLVKGGQITLQPGGSFDADDGRHVTFQATVKLSGGKVDKYNRYVFPAGAILELIDNKEAVAKLRTIAKQ